MGSLYYGDDPQDAAGNSDEVETEAEVVDGALFRTVHLSSLIFAQINFTTKLGCASVL